MVHKLNYATYSRSDGSVIFGMVDAELLSDPALVGTLSDIAKYRVNIPSLSIYDAVVYLSDYGSNWTHGNGYDTVFARSDIVAWKQLLAFVEYRKKVIEQEVVSIKKAADYLASANHDFA